MNGSITPPAQPQPATVQVLPLPRVRAGAPARIRALAAQPTVACRLRELGFCEGQRVTTLSGGGQTICLIRSARLALSGRLAECVLVEAATEDVQRASPMTMWERVQALWNGLWQRASGSRP